jgi:hypothetical protein
LFLALFLNAGALFLQFQARLAQLHVSSRAQKAEKENEHNGNYAKYVIEFLFVRYPFLGCHDPFSGLRFHEHHLNLQNTGIILSAAIGCNQLSPLVQI